MTEPTKPSSLPHHLEHLAMDADDIVAMLTRLHRDGGDVHPEALPKAERLSTSLRQMAEAFRTHAPLAANADDVLRMLGIAVPDPSAAEETPG